RSQPRQKLLALERFDEIVVRARVEALDARLNRISGGQDEDRNIVGLAHAPGDFDPVEQWQPEVEDHEIGEARVRLLERPDPVAGDLHVVALEAQRALQHLGNCLVVLDDEHSWRTLVFGHLQAMVKGGIRAEGPRAWLSKPSVRTCPPASERSRRLGAPAARCSAPALRSRFPDSSSSPTTST